MIDNGAYNSLALLYEISGRVSSPSGHEAVQNGLGEYITRIGEGINANYKDVSWPAQCIKFHQKMKQVLEAFSLDNSFEKTINKVNFLKYYCVS